MMFRTKWLTCFNNNTCPAWLCHDSLHLRPSYVLLGHLQAGVDDHPPTESNSDHHLPYVGLVDRLDVHPQLGPAHPPASVPHKQPHPEHSHCPPWKLYHSERSTDICNTRNLIHIYPIVYHMKHSFVSHFSLYFLIHHHEAEFIIRTVFVYLGILYTILIILLI